MNIELTGAELVHALWVAANERDVTLHVFIAPLTGHPGKWVKQLRDAKSPKPATVERVRALIEGRELPPPANQPQRRYTTCHRSDREGFGLPPSRREIVEQRGLERQQLLRDNLEWRRAVAEAAAIERLPGETLDAAVRRVERELVADPLDRFGIAA